MGKRPQLLAISSSASPPFPGRGDVAGLSEAADADAAQRVLQGDTDAFATIVRRHGQNLTALCSHIVGSAHLGEELAQESLARAYSRLGSWRGDCAFRHWLRRIAVNCCRDFLKAGARAEKPTQFLDEELVCLKTPESETDNKRIITALNLAIQELPAKYREAFVLFHVENLDYEQIKEITGISVGALKVRVHRARHLLRTALGSMIEEQ
jgi:RNA polymerase sigma-70 factor (ECF subfamily)